MAVQRGGRPVGAPVFGCATTGETWQFLRLDEPHVLLGRTRYYLDNLSGILGVLQAIVREAQGVA